MKYSDITRNLWSIYSPLLLVLGLIGNSLSILVSSRQSMRRGIAASRYLLAIAVTDNGALIFGLLPKWLQHCFGTDVTTSSNFVCKMRNFLFYTAEDASTWFVCAFTFDRFLVVQFPLRRAVIGATKRIYVSLAAVTFLAVVKNSTVFWSRAVVVQNQTIAEGNGSISTSSSSSRPSSLCSNPTPSSIHFDSYVRPWLVFATVDCVPFLFLIACNAAIVRKIITVHYKSSKALGASTVVSRSLPVIGISKSRVARMTGMCLAVSLTFLVLEFPSIVLLIGRPYWTTDDRIKYALMEAVASLLTYTNCAVNFYLYCLAGTRFRKEFVSMITRDRQRRHLSTKFARTGPDVNGDKSRKNVRRMTDANLIEGQEVTRPGDSCKHRVILVHQIARPSRSSTM